MLQKTDEDEYPKTYMPILVRYSLHVRAITQLLLVQVSRKLDMEDRAKEAELLSRTGNWRWPVSHDFKLFPCLSSGYSNSPFGNIM
jgi:hypothetical protein